MFIIFFDIFLASVVRSTIFEYWGRKTTITMKYNEMKWYIKPTKCGYYRVMKKYYVFYK